MAVGSIPDEIITAVRRARAIVVFTGAGVSAESGIPTFRSPGGIWEKFRPEDLATPQAFASNPKRVWDWYLYRRAKMAETTPNPGHYAIAAWEQVVPKLSVVTQNIDGLHQRAGSMQVHELHGNIRRSHCHQCGLDAGEAAPAADGELPRCGCGGLIRPSVVWFGETLPEQTVHEAWNAVEEADVFFSVGTSSVVYPAAGLIEIARRTGSYLIEVNPEETELSGLFHACLRGRSGITLPEISRRLGVPSPAQVGDHD